MKINPVSEIEKNSATDLYTIFTVTMQLKFNRRTILLLNVGTVAHEENRKTTERRFVYHASFIGFTCATHVSLKDNR